MRAVCIGQFISIASHYIDGFRTISFSHGEEKFLTRATRTASTLSYLAAPSTSAGIPPGRSITTKSLNCGLLFSSFNDGLRPNKSAHSFLQHGLVQSVLWRRQRELEEVGKESVEQSPCCGPNLQKLEELGEIDEKISQVWKHESPLDLLSGQIKLRFVYIPTAMYALRPESNNTPGKQRQRARADGKKRRKDIVSLLQKIMDKKNSDAVAQYKCNIQVVTVDLDDDSVKQTDGFDCDDFPTSGKEALQEWNPNLVYVEGGNTFWLHHCMNKGGYQDLLKKVLCSSATCYCGSSAGAILVGASMQTACWKGWDDPRVVPGRESYNNWLDVDGLNLVDGRSFFPHMEELRWRRLVDEKRSDLSFSGDRLISLKEEEVFCFARHSMGEPFVVSA